MCSTNVPIVILNSDISEMLERQGVEKERWKSKMMWMKTMQNLHFELQDLQGKEKTKELRKNNKDDAIVSQGGDLHRST